MKMPCQCPACGKMLTVTELSCPECGTHVQGQYDPGPFFSLTPEQLSFCLLFLRCRGSLKDVGAEMNISYPTARNRLDELLRALGLDAPAAENTPMEVLSRLSRGEIDAATALRLLKGAEE